MKIRNRLKLNTLVSLGVVILIMVSLAWALREESRAKQGVDLADEMHYVAFERVMLRDDYLLHMEERARIQWLGKSETFRGILDIAERHFTDGGDREILHEIRENFEATFNSFSRFMNNRKSRETTGERDFDITEAESKLVTQTFLKAYLLLGNIHKLQHSTGRTTAAVRDRSIYMVVFFIIAGVTVIVVNSTVLIGLLKRRIDTLDKGIMIIGSGDMDYRIDESGGDELSELARLSNEMAARLKESHTSVENLKREVASRESAEEEVRRFSEDLKRSNEDLQRFAYIASHDLQEPLRTISSFLQLIEKRNRDLLDADSKEFISFAVSGANRLQNMINSLLDYSRLESRGNPFVPVDSGNTLRKVIGDFGPEIERTDTVVTFADLPVVLADPDQFGQLFQNLVGNAIKFRGEEPPRIHVSARRKAGEWVFSVRDNGIGIDPRHKDRIFVIFQRLHTMDKYTGTGIGLSICKKIVERHGGRIWVESEPGKGSTICFTIPAEEADFDDQARDL